MTHNLMMRAPRENQDPEIIEGFAALMRRALSGDDLGTLAATLLAREGEPPALMDLSTILHMRGTPDIAASVQSLALAHQQIFRLRSSTAEPRVRLLVMMVPGDLAANTPVEYLVEKSDVRVDLLYVAPSLPLPSRLPEHDVLLVGVGVSDEHRPVLDYIQHLIEDWHRPVLNPPLRIAALSRDGVCALLANTPGLVVPQTNRIARDSLASLALGRLPITSVLPDGFPIIIRPVGSQMGMGLSKIDRWPEIGTYLDSRPEPEFFLAPFVDYRSEDGLYRKFRVVFIDGKPLASHMAISENWMIHYIKTGMTVSSARRAEEALFMNTFDDGFARKHEHALRTIADRVKLDYVVMDCAETRDGKLLVFEIDNSAVVHAIDPVDLFPYKQPQMSKVFAAFREMLIASTTRARVRSAAAL